MEKIKIGTRGSLLAMWQAEHIAELLNKAGLATELVTIETKGDKVLDVSIAKIGSKGVFTEELEEQLASGSVHIAVHSAKDLQSTLPRGFEIIAFTERERVNDVLVSHKKGISLEDRKTPIVVGTSSTRRVAVLKHYFPHIKTVEVRGNLQTRFRKMEEGHCDALLLAYAGVHRMGLADKIAQVLDTDLFVPAVGQGSVAVEASSSLDPAIKKAIRDAVNHDRTAARLIAERAFLETLEGGCSIPVFGLATLHEDRLKIKGGIISLNGKTIVQDAVTGKVADARALGKKLAERLLDKGGDAILKEIKMQLKK
ncbi:hydroxymethylbilane synthase [Imperialibacter roseus]|uniref:Porphobilinogen deaminase n=1 Tax=Imperialibacter roseus TaxID=1324217 RepID=A0ABZ0IMV7_9BACT|nr:hydroxymethylbilane synthase [Imperialibacter roseus]WOK05847.1 hydroxymethylbilane synthase [Imperialibacter roseus]